jgi:hypothetical protein
LKALARQEVEAIHEAGHATISHYFGHKIAEVVRRPDESYTKLSGGQKVNGLDFMIHCCAGKAGVDKLYGYKAEKDTNWRGSKDCGDALAAALRLSGNDTEAAELLVWWAERMAEVLVERQWGQVCRLANALLEHGSLSGEAVNQLFNGSNGAVVNTT